MLVGVKPHHRLEDRADHLKGQRDESDLSETELEGFLQQRVDRRDQGLNGIVQKMTETQREKDRQRDIGRIGRSGQGRDSLGWWSDEMCFWHKKSPASFREQGG